MRNPLPYSNSYLPTAYERKQLFYWIKRISSYTAWNRVLGYYRTWAAQMERSVALEADTLKPGMQEQIGTGSLLSVLKGLSYCERAVARLRTGDKRIFEHTAQGDLVMAYRSMSWWNELQSQIDYNGYGFRTGDVPEWDKLEEARANLAAAWTELDEWMTQPPHIEDPSGFLINAYVRDHFSRMSWPDPLPEVPQPAEEVLVRSGHIVPYSGIWEPVTVKWSGGFAGLFKKPEEPQGSERPIEGAMAYLYGSHVAQNRDTEGPGRDGAPTTWRLIWRDDRYEDGTIPAEEADYKFVMPEGRPRPRPAPDLMAEGKWSEIVVNRTGESFDLTGRWAVKDDLNASEEFYAGQPVPQHNGRDVEWVWCGRSS
jgi:hypothetical protein